MHSNNRIDVAINHNLWSKISSVILGNKLTKSTHAEIKKQTLALSNILNEFEINRLGKLMFRIVVNSFFLEGQMDGRTDGRTSRVMT